jgi:aspartokinase
MLKSDAAICDGLPVAAIKSAAETAFEKQRGVSQIERRDGFCQVHVTDLGAPVMASRIAVLRAVSSAGVSLDFLKLTPTGLSFLVRQEDRTAIEQAMPSGANYSLQNDRSIVMVHAVNIRDEEGLIAEVVQSAIASGAHIDHIGDGHDRLLFVAGPESVEKIVSSFQTSLNRSARLPRTA